MLIREKSINVSGRNILLVRPMTPRNPFSVPGLILGGLVYRLN